MAVENTAGKMMSSWIDRLAGSERDIQRLTTNQHDIKAAISAANSDSKFAVDQWNRSIKNDGAESRSEWIHRQWSMLKTSAVSLNGMAEQPVAVGSIADVAMQPSEPGLETEIKGRVINNMQQLETLSTKQRGLRAAIDQLVHDKEWETDQWNNTVRHEQPSQYVRTLESYWDTLRAQFNALGKES